MKFAFLLFLVWLTNNCAVDVMNLAKAPMLMPVLNTAIGVIVGYVAVKAKSRVGAVVFGLFMLSGAIWWTAYYYHVQSTRLPYDLTGVTFLIRALIIGGAGVKEGLAHWDAWSHPGLGNPAPSRTPHVE